MRTLGIDIETYSSVDLVKTGVYAYASAPDFEILLFAYAYDDEDVKLIDLANGESLPEGVARDIFDDQVIKAAFNAQFERVCLSAYLGRRLKAAAWHCTAVEAGSLGLPRSLKGVSEVIGLSEEKMDEGKSLIRYFCMPCKGTKTNGGRARNFPFHAPEKWETFRTYCKQDVEVERAIRRKLAAFKLSDEEQKLYALDQEINDRGVLVDMRLVENAIKCNGINQEAAFKRAKELTGLENPNSVAQMKEWLLGRGISIESLSKQAISELIEGSEGVVKEALLLRQSLSKTSIKKYEAMKRSACPDERLRGLFRFYGANRTGRWSGTITQVQNLPQNHEKDLTLARELLRQERFEGLELFFENVPNLLSELIRTAFIPKSGCRFIAADFSAIEARVIAWLAGEKWRMDVFSSHGKIYEASASQMFRVPVDEITKKSVLRQKGKISELALGYGGSVGALTAMGALDMGLQKEELEPLVRAWRNANQNITRFWWSIDRAAMKAVREKNAQMVRGILLEKKSGILFITLPSGRKLSYIKPRIELNRFGREGITFEGIGATKKWERIETYGPKLVENIVQATARDLLAEAMKKLEEAGYRIVMHVHDEVILEVPLGQGTLQEACEIMAIGPAWAEGLPLKADGFECEYYRKD